MSEETEKIFSVNTHPRIFPVLVSSFKLSASQCEKLMFPVFLFIDNEFDAITFFKLMLPVLPTEERFSQVISDSSAFPVFVTAEIFPSLQMDKMDMLPVFALTATLQ